MAMKSFLYLLCWGVALLFPAAAQASLPLNGVFQADKTCPALHSIKKNTNPGRLFVQPGQRYPVNAQNRAAATHYLVRIEEKQRWVSLDCGSLVEGGASASSVAPTTPTGAPSGDFLLAVSWQPAFCQTHQNKKECKTQTADRYDATHPALHGLWPQPKNRAYCNISTTHKAIDRRGAWHLLPKLEISNELRRELDIIMPATASDLQRHEWYKHGSCYGSPEVYYRDSVALMKQLNASAVQGLFADNIGKRLTAKQIRAAFDKSFGAGSGAKVNVRCSGKLVGEIWVNLRGTITAGTSLAKLLKQAPKVRKLSCDGGVIDPAGF